MESQERTSAGLLKSLKIIEKPVDTLYNLVSYFEGGFYNFWFGGHRTNRYHDNAAGDHPPLTRNRVKK